MKLNTKFQIIVGLTVLMVVILTFATLRGSRRMQEMKSYQYMQSKVQADLSDAFSFLNEMDYWGFNSTSAGRDFEDYISTLDDDFDYLIDSENLKPFPSDFRESTEQMSTLWGLLKNRFEPVVESLNAMQEISLDNGVANAVQSYGIRYAAENETAESAQKLYELLLVAHEEMNGIRRSHKSIQKFNNQAAYQIEEILEASEKRIMLITIIFAAASCLGIAFIITLVTKRISKRIVNIKDVTSILAEKDFTVEVSADGSDEMISLQENLNNMVKQINDFFIVVKTTASKAISSGYKINDSANSTAMATSEIDSHIEKINEEFAEITETVKRAVGVISEMNVHVSTLVDNSSKQTTAIEDSNKAVNEIVQTLEHMNNMATERTRNAEEMHELIADGDKKITSTSDVLASVTDQLDEVREIVSIINNVAKKTNLLSMNAAIESAHAGEAGKGFSVVAGEIRALADETSKHSEKITNVVQSIVSLVSEANESSSSASAAFSRVSSQAAEIIKSLQEITAGIGKIDSQMHQIKARSQESTSAADEMNEYCSDLAQKQRQVSAEVDTMNDLFLQTMGAIHQIKNGTADIVSRMKDVSDSSKESYKNMTELENVLEQFKTKSETENAEAKVDSENAVEAESPADEEVAEMEAVENSENSGEEVSFTSVEDLTEDDVEEIPQDVSEEITEEAESVSEN